MDKIVLLVEDNPDDVLFMERAFAKAEMSCPLKVARDGRQAVDYLSGRGAYADRSAHPAATHVILDIKLPFLSGLEVLQWMRKEPDLENLPVIVLTSSTERADMDRAFELGAQSYLVKPVAFPSLVTLARGIREWVEMARISQFIQRPLS